VDDDVFSFVSKEISFLSREKPGLCLFLLEISRSPMTGSKRDRQEEKERMAGKVVLVCCVASMTPLLLSEHPFSYPFIRKR